MTRLSRAGGRTKPPRMPAANRGNSSLTLWRACRSEMRRNGRDREWLTTWKTIFQGAERLCRFVDLERERRFASSKVKELYKKFRADVMTKFSFYDIPRGIYWFAQLHRNSPIPSILDGLQPLGHIDRDRLGRKLAFICLTETFSPKGKKRHSDDAIVALAVRAIADELALTLPRPTECVLLRRLRSDRQQRMRQLVRYRLPSDQKQLATIIPGLRALKVDIPKSGEVIAIARNAMKRTQSVERLPSGIEFRRSMGENYFDENPFPKLSRLPDLPGPRTESKGIGNLKAATEQWSRGLKAGLAKVGRNIYLTSLQPLLEDGRPKIRDQRRKVEPNLSDAGVSVPMTERTEIESLYRKVRNSSLTPAFVTGVMVKVVLQVCPSPGDQTPSSDVVCRRLVCLALLRWPQAQARAWPDGIVDIPSDWFPQSKGNAREAPGTGERALILEPLVKLGVLSIYGNHTHDAHGATRYLLNLPDEQWIPDLELRVVEQMLANSDNLVREDLDVLTKPRSNRWA